MKFLFYLFVVSILSTKVVAQEATDSRSIYATDITFSDISGDKFALSERWKVKPVLLYFWATWCPYCKVATPKVVKLNEKYSEFIDVLAINIGVNDSLPNTHKYIRDYQINYPVMFDETSQVSALFNVVGTPVFVIISVKGEILYRSHRYPEEVEATFESIRQQKDENALLLSPRNDYASF